MSMLVIGLILFLGVHSVRIVAEDWRRRRIQAMGELAWKGSYTLIAVVGLVLVVWGYGQARSTPVDLWYPPVWTKHLATLLTIPAFILLVAAKVPGSRIRAAVKHPMVIGVKLWAFAHLLANGRLADVVLFGAFLVWAILDLRAARQRDRATGVVYRAGPVWRDLIAVIVGLAAWAAFAMYLHAAWIGVRPFG
ncbi:MAG: hypothetical protein KJ040_12190 [Gammaproteobacteria bacterium]|nr:hypothetical protein [Gammaproteobacteria bacterium]